jgi:hypothetical protein
MCEEFADRPQARLDLCVRAAQSLRREDGQSMVESALSLVLTFTLAFLLFESSMLAYTYSVMNNAAREGVRYAIIHGTNSSSCSGPSFGCDSTAAGVTSVVNTYAANSFHNISSTNMAVTVSYPDATKSQPMSLVTVKVDYAFVPYFKFPGLTNTLHTTSYGRILY